MSLSDPPDDADYDIAPELRMRKLLERMTPYWVEFSKNDRYDYDLECHQWSASGAEYEKSLMGFVELEHADSWDGDDLPENWIYFSALRRKVHQYDHTLRVLQSLTGSAEAHPDFGG